ncbi:MAG TPA: hypothetical protein VHB97_22780 [Polyangia bacterium]|jgi:hypothetical protein|nr:hypothetical protein [Polyangia bacterium]
MSEGEQAFDEGRQLCDDGNCLGVVADGKCNVCGMAAAGTSPRDPSTGMTMAGTSPRDPSTGQSSAQNGAGDMVAEGGHTDDAFDGEDRRLCADGACTGLLGSDGKCKVCGRSSSNSGAS